MDPVQVDQILANLCVNARDAIDGFGTITVGTGNSFFNEAAYASLPDLVPGHYVRLAVTDDGCGMDAETRAHMFEPFFTTKGVGEGTGLGLASVYGAVKQNGGAIDVRSQPGTGTTITIYLPRAEATVTQPETEAATGSSGRGHETILLVEDEPTLLKLTTLVLERQGYEVLGASAPGDAIRLASEHAGQIQLLMTDVVMPEMNGQTLAKQVLSSHPHSKCLFMSGYTADVVACHGVVNEAVNFLQKPFSIEAVLAKVRATLDGE
jgi:CheY-like chemotaxis protein